MQLVGRGTSYACQFVDTVDRNPKNHHVLDTLPVGLTHFNLSTICCFSLLDKNIHSEISFFVLWHPRHTSIRSRVQTPVQGLATSMLDSNSSNLTVGIAMDQTSQTPAVHANI